MQKMPTLSSVNEMISLAVTTPGSYDALKEEEKEVILKEADRLPIHWLRSAYKKSKKTPLDCLVQLAQNTTVYLLNNLYNDFPETASGFKTGLEHSLTRFIHYLQSGFRNHFDFNAPMPRNLWEPRKSMILETLLPGEKCSLKETDKTLTVLVYGQYLIAAGIQVPSFAKGYYWEKLADSFRHSPPSHDATLRTIYTLVSCNFNHPEFAKYVVAYYGRDLPLNTDTKGFWTEHIFQLKRIVEIPEMALEPKLPHCKQMLFTEINDEIEAYVYTNKAGSLIPAPGSFKTTLSTPQLALFYRLIVEAGILVADNKTDLMKLVAQVYEISTGSRSYQHLRDVYYKIDPAAAASMKTYLINMLNLLRGLVNK